VQRRRADPEKRKPRENKREDDGTRPHAI
jgi:hypothetical protein